MDSPNHEHAPDLSVSIGDVTFNNPVMVASGTFGYGREFARVFDLSALGAIMVKGVSLEPWRGNAVPRIVETPAGMLNAIGLQNPGVDHFLREDLPFLREFDTKVIVNVIGRTVEEYRDVVQRLDEVDGADAFEINISCPNIKEGGISFGASADSAARVVEAVRKVTQRPVIPKLSPNVTDVAAMAVACQEAGADAVSAINTLMAMVIDVDKERPVLANQTGGLSGPAIRPIAVRMVWEIFDAVRIPIIGMGGIVTPEDALQFVLAGASAVAVGTANFLSPTAALDVLKGIEDHMARRNESTFLDMVGKAKNHTRRATKEG